MGSQLMLGQIEKVHYLDDQTNISKEVVEYDVIVKDAHGGQLIFRNVKRMERFGGLNDTSEEVLESNEHSSQGPLDLTNAPINKNGTMVIVAFLNNNFDRPFILGCITHPKKKGSNKSKGIHSSSEYRGVVREIDQNGNLTVTVNGAKKPDGKTKDATFTPVTFRFGKDGKISTGSGHKISLISEQGKQQVKIETAGKQLFVIDDTTGKESITMLQKQGALINMTKNGSITVQSKDGNLLFLNSEANEASLIQKNGALLSLTPSAVTLSDASGKQLINMTDSKVQLTSSDQISLQTSGFGVNAGTMLLKDTIGAQVHITSGKVAIGTSAAELLDLVSQLIDSAIQTNTAASTIIVPTAVGPSSVPVNAAQFITQIATLNIIKALLTTIKGSVS